VSRLYPDTMGTGEATRGKGGREERRIEGGREVAWTPHDL